MRRLAILLVLVFVVSLVSVAALGATKSYSKAPRTRAMTISKKGVKMRCYPVKRYRAKAKKKSVARAMPARRGAGPAARPVVNCPAPVVNVPQQPAPVVNVPEQPAPVVNVAAPPPSTAITVDATCIYIVRDNQLLILGKSDLCLKSKVSLDQVASMPMAATSSQ